MKKITLAQAIELLRTYHNVEIGGGNFETLTDFAQYYAHHGAECEFIAEDLAALIAETVNE